MPLHAFRSTKPKDEEPLFVSAPPNPEPRPDRGIQVAAGILPTAATALLLVLLALAIIRPELPLMWTPMLVAAVAAVGWWVARVDVGQLQARVDWLTRENVRRTADLERLSDTAWELREGEERYRSLIDAQGDLVVRRDRKGRLTFLNPAFAETFGIDAAVAIGQSLALGPPWRPAAGAAVVAKDIRIDTPAGERWFSWIDVPVRGDDGKLGPCYSVARDITARKESEQALDDARQKAEAGSRAKSRLLATVSHEFRTPLNGILGLIMLLRESGLTTDQQTYAEGVQSSGETLLALVNDMLDFSRIEAGRLELRPETTAVEPLVRDVVELLAVRAHHKGIDIAADVDPDVPDVKVDPVRLRQVLINLAGNGIKFTETGGVTVSVRQAARDDESSELVFTVSDTGPGIAADEADRLFEEFEQSDNTINRRHGGAGLGLAISRRIVRHMGGDLALVSTAGPGASFSFALELPVVATKRRAEQRLDGKRILILARQGAEPSAAVRQLEAVGAEARVVDQLAVAGGLVAAALAAGHGYHALIVDNSLPGPAAADLDELRAAAGRRLPAAVLIEPDQRVEVGAFKAAGFDAYLIRPPRRGSLLRIVGSILTSPDAFCGDPRDDRAREAPPPPSAADRLDILLAEDNEISALLARTVLEGLGHNVTEVHDGGAAVAAVEAHETPFGAILMDLHMPHLDGLAAVRQIRAREAAIGAPAVPVLALTADVLPETREAAGLAGITAIVSKPVTPDALRKALAGVVAGIGVAAGDNSRLSGS